MPSTTTYTGTYNGIAYFFPYLNLMKNSTRITIGIASILFISAMSTATTLAAETELKIRVTEAECQALLSPAAFSTQTQYEDAHWDRRNSVSRQNLVAWLKAHNAFRQEQQRERVEHLQQVIACDKLTKRQKKNVEASEKRLYAFHPSKYRLGMLLPAMLLVTGGNDNQSPDDQNMLVPNRQDSIWRDVNAAFSRPTRRSLIVDTEAGKMERMLSRR